MIGQQRYTEGHDTNSRRKTNNWSDDESWRMISCWCWNQAVGDSAMRSDVALKGPSGLILARTSYMKSLLSTL